jgi:hypothetical protein
VPAEGAQKSHPPVSSVRFARSKAVQHMVSFVCTDAKRMFVTNVLTKDKANIELTHSSSRANIELTHSTSCDSGTCE